MKSGLNSIGRLSVGQAVRITKRRHIQGLPVLDPQSWVNDVTEGTLTKLRRVDGGIMATIANGSSAEFFVGVSPLGPLLNHNGIRVEILSEGPDQRSLLSEKGGEA